MHDIIDVNRSIDVHIWRRATLKQMMGGGREEIANLNPRLQKR